MKKSEFMLTFSECFLNLYIFLNLNLSESKILVSQIRLNLSEISLNRFRRIQMFSTLSESFQKNSAILKLD